MITVSYIKVIPESIDSLKVSWMFKQTPEDFRDYTFTLERSEDPETGFLPIFNFNHAMDFIDTFPNRKIWRNLYYRVTSKNIKTGETFSSQSFPLSVEPDLEAIEIVRRNDILLKNRRHGTGSPVAVFRLKTFGPKCNVCWDFNKQKVRTSSCDVCYKTGIEGGYYAPIITWANLNPPQKMIQLPQWGEMEGNEQRFFFNNNPALNPKDLIFVPSSLIFYQVERVETSTRREYILHQIVAASGIERTSIVYNLLKEYPDLVKQLSEARKQVKLK